MDSEDCVDIPVEQIVGKFHMLFCRESQQPSTELKNMNSTLDMYVCRYKIVFSNGKYGLVPRATLNRPVDINQTPQKEKFHDKENYSLITSNQTIDESIVPMYRLSPNKRCIVTPIKIKVPKTSLQAAEDDSDTAVSPQKRKRKVRRNLNVSLDDTYSLEEKDNFKIKSTNNQQKWVVCGFFQQICLRLNHFRHTSDKNDEKYHKEDFIQNTPTYKTRSKRINEENLTPMTLTQTRLSQICLQDTPKSSARKSILKTPSTCAAASK